MRRNCNNTDKIGRTIILEENHNVEDMELDGSIKSTPLFSGKNLKSSLTLTLKRTRRRAAAQNHNGNSIYNEDDDEDIDDEDEDREDDENDDDQMSTAKIKATNGRRHYRKRENYRNINKTNDKRITDTNVNINDDDEDADDDDEAAINELARRGNNHLIQAPSTSSLKNLNNNSSPAGVNRR